MKERVTVKYANDTARCPKCRGMLAYDGTFRDRLPLGFGFAPGSSRFRVDCVERKGFTGECMECGTKVLAVKSRRHVTRTPRGINNKLAAARKAA